MAEGCDETCRPQDLSHAAPAYRRTLWIVVLLNLGMGVAEMTGGLVAGSQALKADALDFVGDGVITMFGLIAIAWSLAWRARAALIQGFFLAALGTGVLGATAYRVLASHNPEANIMGVFGLIALAVNVAAAWVLVPHRKGDANVRAVWLFSRNDALGNVAVVGAAGTRRLDGNALAGSGCSCHHCRALPPLRLGNHRARTRRSRSGGGRSEQRVTA